jgi:hypothetical protein
VSLVEMLANFGHLDAGMTGVHVSDVLGNRRQQ